MKTLERFIDLEKGSISPAIFWDPEIYQEELKKIFTKSWLFVAHESQIKQPGDYVTNYMGEDPVIITRDLEGKIHVFLNACPHRGMMICRTDAGNSRFYRCPYHGWTFENSGNLIGVPEFEYAYWGELDRSKYRLREVPRVESYKGFIFANWDPNAAPFVEYAGKDFLWYMDLAFEKCLGNFEVTGPVMKLRLRTNWKIPTENFGDDYHVLYTHGSAFKIGFMPPYDAVGSYNAYCDNGHSVADIPEFGKGLELDRMIAKQLGPEAERYLESVDKKLREKLSPVHADLHQVGQLLIFPNLTFLTFGVFRGIHLFQWHPKGVDETELWQIPLYDSEAPDVAKEYARRFSQRENAPGGIFAADDGENFEQITKATKPYVTRQFNFDYSMGIRHEGEIQIPGLPGVLGRHYSEQNQRNYYRYWLKLMSEEGVFHD
ncbi:aromatic ring-hydroxylating oxygenase subunit alpha [Kyrpidia tusciae]|uniref:Rieske (2Fe-2S) iron-sulfur domain protein n=1 Tax=Kyrpidia tusciae (strain DSM 2912 / NBRC 15312 / T2) TaxID=562970 RepID=D5WS34_KYRT2|nr:aromatic ring-hydroxylating dioxygenase subunit alpha [Kyrpidia tusciae]ADG06986.1 Rieske (2Fe-2S) iron-sulfur domain protein [Kyrpidia tusciae DSM 2912]